MLEFRGGVIWHPDQALRKIKAKTTQRVRDAANLLRRTTRLALNQKAPQRKTKGGALIFGTSLPGEPPFRRTGSAYYSVGFDFKTKTASFDSLGRVGVDTHGHETGRSENSPGVKRPALVPAYRHNKSLIAAVMLGKTSAPQYGSISFVTHRQPFRVVLSKSGKTQRVEFGATQRGTYQRYKKPVYQSDRWKVKAFRRQQFARRG